MVRLLFSWWHKTIWQFLAPHVLPNGLCLCQLGLMTSGAARCQVTSSAGFKGLGQHITMNAWRPKLKPGSKWIQILITSVVFTLIQIQGVIQTSPTIIIHDFFHLNLGLNLNQTVGIQDICKCVRCTAHTFPYLSSPFVVLTFAF